MQGCLSVFIIMFLIFAFVGDDSSSENESLPEKIEQSEVQQPKELTPEEKAAQEVAKEAEKRVAEEKRAAEIELNQKNAIESKRHLEEVLSNRNEEVLESNYRQSERETQTISENRDIKLRDIREVSSNLVLDDKYSTANYHYHHFSCRDGNGLYYASKYVQLLTTYDDFEVVESGIAPTGRAKYWALAGNFNAHMYRFESELAHMYVDAYENEVEILLAR